MQNSVLFIDDQTSLVALNHEILIQNQHLNNAVIFPQIQLATRPTQHPTIIKR